MEFSINIFFLNRSLKVFTFYNMKIYVYELLFNQLSKRKFQSCLDELVLQSIHVYVKIFFACNGTACFLLKQNDLNSRRGGEIITENGRG